MSVTSTRTIVVGRRAPSALVLARWSAGRGLLIVLLGVLVLGWTTEWPLSLAVLSGATLVSVGGAELMEAVKRRRLLEDWVFEAVRGVGLIGAGGYLLLDRNPTTSDLAAILGATLVGCGLADVVEGRRARRGAPEGRWRKARGVVALVAGGAMLVWPDLGPERLVSLFGGALVTLGVLSLVASVVLRRTSRYRRGVRLDVIDDW